MPDLQDLKMPQHVAIILDGNGRWAKNKGMVLVAAGRIEEDAVYRPIHT